MVSENFPELLDFVKQGWHSMLWVLVVPLLILIGPAQAVHQFTFHRMQHYEFAGSIRGSPGVALNCEVRTLFSTSVARRCLVISWKEFVAGDLSSIVQKGIVALIVALPANLTAISGEQRDAFIETEQTALRLELQIPVYFVVQTAEVSEWLDSLNFHVGQVNTPQTATEELIQQISGDYYYISSSLYSPKVISDVKVSNLIGRLGEESSSNSDQKKAIVLLAHLDSAGIAPGLSHGADSDATGIAAVVELVRIVSKLLRSQKSPPKTELIVILSGGGKFNFFGTKKWLDEQGETAESGLLSRIQYAICLDGIGKEFPPKIFVSRPPREDTPLHRLFQAINGSSSKYFDQSVPLVHKKINLAEDELVWEHEQFSLVKVPAFTISTFPSQKVAYRRSILDVRSDVDVVSVVKTVQVLADSLISEMYGLQQQNVMHEDYLKVSEENIVSWIDLLTRHPRSLQLLNSDHPGLSALKDYLGKHLSDFKIKQLSGEKGESDIILHGPVDVIITASRTKQPFFDLLVTLIIGLYAAAVFALLQYLDIIRIGRSWIKPLVSGSAIKLRNAKYTK